MYRRSRHLASDRHHETGRTPTTAVDHGRLANLPLSRRDATSLT